MSNLLPVEVFIPAGLPQVTYVAREHLDIETKVKAWREGKHTTLLSVSGPTKTGKTVLLTKQFPDAIRISGGAIESVEEFWEEVCNELEVYTCRQLSVDANSSSGEQVGGGINSGFASGEVQASGSRGTQRGVSLSRTSSAKSAARAELRKVLPTLIIDDFHYIAPEIQVKIVKALKDLIFDSLPVVFVSVPHRSYDAVKVEREMTGRITEVSFGEWSTDDLQKIATQGFSALGMRIDDNIMLKLATESWGSPHLMQSHCLSIALRSPNIPAIDDVQRWNDFFSDQVSGESQAAYHLLKQGPRQRNDRIQRSLKNGILTDIYGAVLAAIASTGPQSKLQYEDLRAALRNVLNSDLPQRHEVTNVLDQMTGIARDVIPGEPMLEYDSEYSTLYIADPFFAYFLRWAPDSLKSLSVQDRSA